jgi:hypothetical protein
MAKRLVVVGRLRVNINIVGRQVFHSELRVIINELLDTTISRYHVQLVVYLIQVDDRLGPIWS